MYKRQVMKDAQNKLSKRNGDASYQDLVAKGYLPAAVLNYLLLLGWAPEGEQEIFSLDEMIKIWDPARISKSPAIFDPLKLRAINAAYIRALPAEEDVYKRQALHCTANARQRQGRGPGMPGPYNVTTGQATMSDQKRSSGESFAGNVMKYSVATYLGFAITGLALSLIHIFLQRRC